MGKMAGFGYSIRTRFKRSNPPWSMDWGHGGVSQQYYSISDEMAAMWLEQRARSEVTESEK